MYFLREGLFECCSSASFGKPEFLSKEKLISARPGTSLAPSSTGNLDLYYQRWQSDRRQQVRAVVFVHSGETDHAAWYNALAVRLAAAGCVTVALDPQGFGQSDGARGYFESFQEVVDDFVCFVKAKWTEMSSQQGFPATLIVVAKGLGALVAMSALPELRAMALESGTVPALALLSPGFQFARFISDQSGVSCGLNSAQCARQPLAQCARAPIAFTPTGETQKLEYLSRWFPKMIVTQPVDPDLVCRDPQAVERMARDHLIWRQGYRARVLSEIVEAQNRLLQSIEQHGEDFQCPALILHGSGDKLYSVQGSIGIHSAWCQGVESEATALVPRLKIYDGAYHQLLNEPNKDEVMNDIVNFALSSLTGY
ncbi:unnamed protein product [Symbiodinium natans]|uniref:Serine aminopeptidase S33 domain-containing protein n=1 Tax=Symbiodinium natans TaxID=878477 RepID=A0A812R445_9DINO|nr:unnamed protein product [Symbiodinium natans]